MRTKYVCPSSLSSVYVQPTDADADAGVLFAVRFLKVESLGACLHHHHHHDPERSRQAAGAARRPVLRAAEAGWWGCRGKRLVFKNSHFESATVEISSSLPVVCPSPDQNSLASEPAAATAAAAVTAAVSSGGTHNNSSRNGSGVSGAAAAATSCPLPKNPQTMVFYAARA